MFGSRLFMKQSRFVSKDSKFRKVSKKVQSLESSSGKSFYAFLCGRPEVRSCTLSLRLPVCDIPADLLTEVETVEVEKSKHLTSLETVRKPPFSGFFFSNSKFKKIRFSGLDCYFSGRKMNESISYTNCVVGFSFQKMAV